MFDAALNFAPFALEGRKTILLARDDFAVFGAKTAVCYLRYRGGDVVSVVDPRQAGRSARDVLGFGGAVPVDATVEAALERGPELAVIGVAPSGGRLIPDLRRDVCECVRAGVDVASGLHDFIADDAEIMSLAAKSGARVWDARRVPEYRVVGDGHGCTTGAKTVLLVGTDCNVGKMTGTVECHRSAVARGINTGWAATGQTGIMLRGRGVAVDRVVADFIAGTTEALVNVEGKDRDLLFVEGQGSIVHPGFSGVTLGLLHGTMPDAMILVHATSRRTIGDTDREMPPLPWFVSAYENAMRPLKQSRVVAILMNTTGLADADVRATIEAAVEATGLPAADPIRGDMDPVLEAVLAATNEA